MANIKSSKKRAITNEVRRKRNVSCRSEIKTIIKKIVEKLEAKNVLEARKLLCNAQSKVARAGKKGVLKKNNASRKIGRLTKMVNAASA